ncbi:sigma-70 family RNA polymerase sigma factor [Nocardioides jishulii]|uniref:Sigma-70 family RNA polymerase sigma factor n=2 Tax=Nocardioides jishulii TaxID=2575440 RepID=A0A4V6X645_9ACTN|nr:sigma-70 family RNA polymerase sigma factor [Nocardioides jishulii]TKI64933.1 sigma-70 family RNA polymerase sigma factor [Nocardioides jishulii]
MPLVGHIVREMAGRVPHHVSRDDLTSAGLVALVRAADSFEQERGVPFARYAATRIRGALIDELRSVDWASRSVRRRARDLEGTRHQLAVALGRVPTNAEVASALGMSLDEVVANDDDVARAQVLSLQGGPDDALDELVPADTATPEQLVLHRERLTYMVEAVDELPERLRVVVTEYFLAERPMTEIAEQLGVSESRVSQLRAEALSLLREALNRELDPDLVTPPSRPEGCAARRRESYFAAVATRHAAALRPAQVGVDARA